ncbi:MAG TPA: pyruvate ferredoxin oxidoreductase [Clostridia bacterium]|nr:pyruvate ferredoxin oxidoreductase [Clostridia bacterium]
MIEIRIHGLGGEGVVSLANMLGDAAVQSGKWAHSLPFFGTEMRGASVKAFVRVSNRPINVKSYVYAPDVIIITNDLLLNDDVIDGLKKGGTVLINTNKDFKEAFKTRDIEFHSIDAIGMAMELFGKPIINTIMFGALSRVVDLFPNEVAISAIEDKFGSKLAKINVEAFQQGYKMGKVI